MPGNLQVDAPTAHGVPSRSSLEGQRCGSRNDRNGGQIARSLIPCLFFRNIGRVLFSHFLNISQFVVRCFSIALAHAHNKSGWITVMSRDVTLNLIDFRVFLVEMLKKSLPKYMFHQIPWQFGALVACGSGWWPLSPGNARRHGHEATAGCFSCEVGLGTHKNQEVWNPMISGVHWVHWNVAGYWLITSFEKLLWANDAHKSWLKLRWMLPCKVALCWCPGVAVDALGLFDTRHSGGWVMILGPLAQE